MKTDNQDMTSGSIFRKLVLFALPLILTGILQQLYNTFDTLIIGKFSSSLALAGVGGSSSMINLIINLFVGMSGGASIIVSQYFGAKNNLMLKKSVHTAIAVALISGVIVMILGLVVLKPLLKLIDTPDNVMPYAVKYTTIYFLGTIPTLLYNFLAGILRAVGDSKRPLYYLIVSAVLNVALNLFFVIVLKMDVEGVAIATIISQALCCIMALVRLTRVDAPYKVCYKDIKIEKRLLIRILQLGVPAGINGALFSISNMLIQSSINGFGELAIAGCAADTNIENFVYVAMNAVAIAASTYVGQNKGAGEYLRIKRGIVYSIILTSVVGLALGISTYAFGTQLMGLFTNDSVNGSEIVRFGMERMSIVATTYFICGIQDVLGNSLRGLGKSLIPMFIAIFGICGLRVIWIETVFKAYPSIRTLFISYPLSWLVTGIVMFVYLIWYLNIEQKSSCTGYRAEQ